MSQSSDFHSYSCPHKDQKITCEGCLYDAPGQRHHMGVGGCLEVSYYHDHQDQDYQSMTSESD